MTAAAAPFPPTGGYITPENVAEAARFAVTRKEVSAGLIQRRLRVGFATAAFLLEWLEALGITGPFAPQAARPVLLRGLAPELAGLIAEFAVARPWLTDPLAVHDRCEWVSGEFARLCTSRGVAATVISGLRFGEIPEFPGRPLLLGGHFAVDASGTVVDWTARQFDPAAPVPLVTVLAEWRRTWRDLAAAHPR